MPFAVDRTLLADYTPKGESPETLALMRRMDELFLKYPLLRRPSDGSVITPRGRAHRSSPGRSSDAPDGASGDLSGASASAIRIPSTGSTPICSEA